MTWLAIADALAINKREDRKSPRHIHQLPWIGNLKNGHQETDRTAKWQSLQDGRPPTGTARQRRLRPIARWPEGSCSPRPRSNLPLPNGRATLRILSKNATLLDTIDAISKYQLCFDSFAQAIPAEFSERSRANVPGPGEMNAYRAIIMTAQGRLLLQRRVAAGCHPSANGTHVVA